MGRKNADPLARATPYTLWLRDAYSKPTFVVEGAARADAWLAQTARRLGVKVTTSRGVAVYGLEAVEVVRVTKVVPNA